MHAHRASTTADGAATARRASACSSSPTTPRPRSARPSPGCPSPSLDTVDHVLVCDDASADDTYEVGLRFRAGSPLPVTVVRHEQNLGYGGNQKAGYALGHRARPRRRRAAPRRRPVRPRADRGPRRAAGQRRGRRGVRLADARRGRRPRGRHAALQVRRQQDPDHVPERPHRAAPHASGTAATAPTASTRWPTSTSRRTPTASTSTPRSSWAWSRAGKRIVEVPIPTYYGDEICYVNGMKYAKDVTGDVVRHWADERGFGGGVCSAETDAYELKVEHGSHGVLLRWLARRAPARGSSTSGCSDGRFADLARRAGPPRHRRRPSSSTRAWPTGSTRFIEADLNQPLPDDARRRLRRHRRRRRARARRRAAPAARATWRPARARAARCSSRCPNFGHWYPRGRSRSASSTTTSAARSTAATSGSSPARASSASSRESGLRIVERATVGHAVRHLADARATTPPVALVARRRRAPTGRDRAWPRLFGYQFLYRLEVA